MIVPVSDNRILAALFAVLLALCGPADAGVAPAFVVSETDADADTEVEVVARLNRVATPPGPDRVGPRRMHPVCPPHAPTHTQSVIPGADLLILLGRFRC